MAKLQVCGEHCLAIPVINANFYLGSSYSYDPAAVRFTGPRRAIPPSHFRGSGAMGGVKGTGDVAR